LRLQEKQLGDDQIADIVVDFGADKNNAVLQKPRVDIVRTLAAAGLLNNDRHQHGSMR